MHAVEQVDLLSQISKALEFVKMIFSLFFHLKSLHKEKLKKNASTVRIQIEENVQQAEFFLDVKKHGKGQL